MPAIWLTLWSSRSQVYVGIFILDGSIKMSDLDVGQLERYLKCLNVKYARRLQNFTNASAHGSPSCLFYTTST